MVIQQSSYRPETPGNRRIHLVTANGPTMLGFADCFWSGDYAGGLGVLFGKLQQGVVENEQVLTIARMRAEAEEQYGTKLGDIAPTTDKMTGGLLGMTEQVYARLVIYTLRRWDGCLEIHPGVRRRSRGNARSFQEPQENCIKH